MRSHVHYVDFNSVCYHVFSSGKISWLLKELIQDLLYKEQEFLSNYPWFRTDAPPGEHLRQVFFKHSM